MTAIRLPGRPGLWLLSLFVVLALVFPPLDGPLSRGLSVWGREGWGHWWALGAYWLGNGAVQIPLAVLWLGLGWWRHSLKEKTYGVAALAATAGGGILTQVVKHIVGRPRPRLDLPPDQLMGFTWDSDWHSFPSGHTMTSFALAAVLAARWPGLAWLWYGLAVLVAAGRVIGGSHYPSDVLGGVALGLMVGLPLAVWAQRRAGEVAA